jgi:hypothetical protein
MRDTIEMAREADLIDDSYASDWYVYQLKAFEALVRADEREACAKVCEEIRHPHGYSAETQDWVDGGNHCVDAIRARGKTK